MSSKAIPTAVLLFLVGVVASSARAQSNNYTQTNLVSNVPGFALTLDQDLLHPWGLSASANQPFRLALNGRGQFTSYDAAGLRQDPRAVIAVPAGVMAAASPTGVAANTTGLFVPSGSLSSPFLFATRQGTISGEYADGRGDILTTTILVVDHSSEGAEYTGLAILSADCCAPYLAAADFHHGYIETFTSFFAPLGIPGAFTDPNLPAGYAPWNLQVAGDQLYVAYAVQDAAQHDPVVGAGNGIVDIYNLDGSFLRRFVSNGPLNVPTAIVQASAEFGAFGNDILIANYGDGLINAFDPGTGQFLGSLKDGNGNLIVNPNLHNMTFGDGTVGDINSLYLTSALTSGTDGLFAAIHVNTTGLLPDFTVRASASTATVSPGQAATFSVTATPVANFRSSFAFSCNAPAGVTCTVGAPSVDVSTGAATATITATPSAASTATSIAAFTLPGILIAGIARRRRERPAFLMSLVIAIAASTFAILGMTGCGGSGGPSMRPGPTVQTLSITATAGPLSRATTFTLNVQ